MNDQDKEAFEEWWDAQPEGLGFPASRADACITWLAALAHARDRYTLAEAVREQNVKGGTLAPESGDNVSDLTTSVEHKEQDDE